MLVGQALGLGGWVHGSVFTPYIYQNEPEKGWHGLGFRMVEPKALSPMPPVPASQPNPVGIDGVLEGLCPPYVKTMDEAIDRVLEDKYGPDGCYGDADVFSRPYKDRRSGEAYLRDATHFSPRAIEYTREICRYIVDTYGRFPAHVDAFYTPGMWLQFGHVETEYYDRFYDPVAVHPPGRARRPLAPALATARCRSYRCSTWTTPPRAPRRPRGSGRSCERWPSGASTSARARGSTRAGSGASTRPSATPTRGRFSRKKFEAGVPGRVRRDVPGRLRRLRLLPVPLARTTGRGCSSETPESLLLRLQGARGHHRRPLARATPGTAPGRARRTRRSSTPALFRTLFARRLEPYAGRVATLIFEFGTFAQVDLPDPRRLPRPARPVPRGAARAGSATRSRSATPSTSARATSRCSPATERRPRLQRLDADARARRPGARCPARSRPTSPSSAPCCARAASTSRRSGRSSRTGSSRSRTSRRARGLGAIADHARRAEEAGVPVRQQPAGRQRPDDDRGGRRPAARVGMGRVNHPQIMRIDDDKNFQIISLNPLQSAPSSDEFPFIPAAPPRPPGPGRRRGPRRAAGRRRGGAGRG